MGVKSPSKEGAFDTPNFDTQHSEAKLIEVI